MKYLMMFLLIAGITINKTKAQAEDQDTTAKHFIIKASIGNLQEVSSGQLAAQKGARPDIKQYGQMMVMDHQLAQQKLMQLAKSRGYNIPPEATTGIMPDLKLKNAASDFDRLYVHAMVVDHRNTVQMFQKYAITGKDPAVKAFAQQNLPTLKQHLEAIKSIDAQIKDVAK